MPDSGSFRLCDAAISVNGLAVFSSEWKDLADALEVKRQSLRRFPQATLSEIWRRVGGASLTISRSVDVRFVVALMSRGSKFQEPPLLGAWVDRKTGEPYGYTSAWINGGPRVTTMRLASALVGELVDDKNRDATFVSHVLMDTDESIGWLYDQVVQREVRGGYGHRAKLPPFESCRCGECKRDWDVPFKETRWISIVHRARAFLEQWELVSWLPGQTVHEVDRRPAMVAEFLQRGLT